MNDGKMKCGECVQQCSNIMMMGYIGYAVVAKHTINIYSYLTVMILAVDKMAPKEALTGRERKASRRGSALMGRYMGGPLFTRRRWFRQVDDPACGEVRRGTGE